jgi:hypothetical protein
MRRREFLKLGSGGVAALALPNLGVFSLSAASLNTRPASVQAAGLPRLAVAYCAQTPTAHSTMPTVVSDRAGRLTAATGLRSGDARLARDGAQLTLRGVAPAGSSVTAVRVLVDFQPFHTTPFHAWSFANGSAAKTASFHMPIDSTAGLNLWLDVQHAGEATPRTDIVRFAVGDDADAPKLRTGTYVIALDSAAGAWSRYRLQALGHGGLGLYRVSSGGSVPADQAHLLLTVS